MWKRLLVHKSRSFCHLASHSFRKHHARNLIAYIIFRTKSHIMNFQHFGKVWFHNNNNNNNPICKAPECQKTSVALAGQEQSCELNRVKSPTE